jgi:hypothetical protein
MSWPVDTDQRAGVTTWIFDGLCDDYTAPMARSSI